MASKYVLFLLPALLVATRVGHGEATMSLTYSWKPKPPQTPLPTPVRSPPAPFPTPVATLDCTPPPPTYKHPTPVAPQATTPPQRAFKPPTVDPPPPLPAKAPPPASAKTIRQRSQSTKPFKECGPLCMPMCTHHALHRVVMCIEACSKCCSQCWCVSQKTFGKKRGCQTCYSQMKTHKTRFKCY